MSELPKGWEHAEVGELCNLINGRAFKPQEWSESGLPIIRIQNLNNPAAKFNYFSGTFDEKHHVKHGDLLFAWSGTPGTSFGAHIWRGDNAVLNQHIFKIEFSELNIDRKFLRYAINQKLEELIGSAQGGVGLRHVTKGTFEKTKISFPPLPEQTRIAAKLDELLAQVDTLKARIDGIPALLKRFRQSVLAAAVSGRLTEEWREIAGRVFDWKETSIDAVCDSSFYGPRFSKEDYVTDGIPTIRTTDMTSKGEILITNETPRINVPKEKIDQFKANHGDLLITRTGSIGTMAVFRGDYDAIPSAYLIRFRFKSTVSVDFIYTFLTSPFGQEKLGLGTTTTTQPNINAQTIRGIKLQLPPVEEQTEIVRRVEQLFAFADQLEAKVASAKSRIDHLTQSILAKAFRGELVPQEPNDEPASVLLERIKAQRAAAPKARRGRKASA